MKYGKSNTYCRKYKKVIACLTKLSTIALKARESVRWKRNIPCVIEKEVLKQDWKSANEL